jgi:hypothetical protein
MRNITSENHKRMNNEEKDSNTFLDNIIKLFNIIWDISFVILPSVGYIHQYMKIDSLKKTEGFSKLISFILIMSYIFRIFFWIGEHFEKSILFNAIFGIIIQLLLLRVCLKYDKSLQKNESLYRFLNIKEFWNWPYFTDYLIFVFFISSLITILSLIVGYNNKAYVFSLGVITSFIESFSDIPQIYELYKSKNPYTISLILILWWLSGDIFKVTYYFFRETPIQLKLCAIFQLTTDIILSLQIVYYRYSCKNKILNNIFNIGNKNKDEQIKFDPLVKDINQKDS